MNIGLIDIDGGKFPNIVLMKLSAYWKQRGATIELIQPNDVLRGQSLFNALDKVYGAVVFEQNRQIAKALHEIGVEIGGSGWNLQSRLPAEIESIYPDYALYGITDTAYGFLTRGCQRGCPFCIVKAKEGGQSVKVADLSQFWRDQKYIKLLDPNLLAYKEHISLLEQLADSGAQIDFTQGLDARLLTKENIKLLNDCKIKMLHFAWDNPKDKITQKSLLDFRKESKIKDFRKMKVYVLTNYWSTHKQDLERVYWLRENGYDPYIMIFDKYNAAKETRHLQRWVNNKRIFRVVERFEDYNHKTG